MSASPKQKHNLSVIQKTRISLLVGGVCVFVIGFVAMYIVSDVSTFSVDYNRADAEVNATSTKIVPATNIIAPLDTVAYDKKIIQIANYKVSSSTSASTTLARSWPVKTVYPNAGALLPFHRIVAYYGNFYSKGMGVLGEYPQAQMLSMLNAEVLKWQAADPTTRVIPAIDYIAVTAQASPGADGKYRFRMPDDQIQHAIDLAAQAHGIVILDVQVGLSNVQTEIPLLKKYLEMPQVHLALDPEFSMKDGVRPGKEIGTMDATDINFAAQYLAALVKADNLPPKILIVHRFTQDMVTHYKQIKPLPEVEIVMDMDGWGFPAKKLNTYTSIVAAEPVQFTGFKLFYKNDVKPPSTHILTPAELLKLTPQPLFIQFQ